MGASSTQSASTPVGRWTRSTANVRINNRKLGCKWRPHRQEIKSAWHRAEGPSALGKHRPHIGGMGISNGMTGASKMVLRVWLFPFCLAIAFTGWAQQAPAHSASRPGGQDSAALAAGRKSFQSHCALCHGLDARGGEHAPGIANSKTVQQESDKALLQTLHTGIPAGGMPSFSYLPESDLGAVVKYLRSLSGTASVEPVKGDPAHGEQLFLGKARCGDCHMMAGKGGFIGPDLSDFAVAHSPQEIRESIVRSDRKLSPGEEVVNVETIGGQRWSGLVRNEDNFSLQLQGTDGAFHMLMKTEIAKLERTGRSLMPADYGTRLSPAELDDVVSYISHSGRHVEVPGSPSGERRRHREE